MRPVLAKCFIFTFLVVVVVMVVLFTYGEILAALFV
jgi:hypothetical protein